MQIDGKGGLGGPDGPRDLGGPGGPGGPGRPSTLMYPSLCLNDVETTQGAGDRYKDNLDGQLTKVVQVVKFVQVIYTGWSERLRELEWSDGQSGLGGPGGSGDTVGPGDPGGPDGPGGQDDQSRWYAFRKGLNGLNLQFSKVEMSRL